MTSVTFPCDALFLEGMLFTPEVESPVPGVVVCHPHPLMGGTMDNNVVISVCQALLKESIASLMFNFRGVGRSQGSHDNGIGEQDDVAAALTYRSSMPQVDSGRIGLCGYSFGAGVALEAAAKTEQAQALALVSPILSHPSPIESYSKPKLLLWGSFDMALPGIELKSFTEELPEPKQYDVIPGADHFWWGYEQDMATRVAAFFSETLK